MNTVTNRHQDALEYYAILHLTAEAGTLEIKQSYRDLAKKWHPDYNKSANALEIFQKLSVAYEVLQDERSRLVYDLLSCVYDGRNFPELENIQPFKGETEDEDIRVFNLQEVRGKLWTYSFHNYCRYYSYRKAVVAEFKTAVLNWLLGWWNFVAFRKNLSALRNNFKNVNSPADNLRLSVHNAVAYYQNGKFPQAARSAVIALEYASGETKLYLQRFIKMLNQKISRPRRWNFTILKIVQLVIPFLVILLCVFPSSTTYISEWDLMELFSGKKQIDYYQEVNFGARGRSVDDVVVGKIISIPVNRSDVSNLYYVKSSGNLMYGPSEDFDILKKLSERTTVRLTGISPDKIWARVMVDNGEMGFVKMENLQQGIGKPVPEFSKVYQAE